MNNTITYSYELYSRPKTASKVRSGLVWGLSDEVSVETWTNSSAFFGES